jgi:hypothetical protein
LSGRLLDRDVPYDFTPLRRGFSLALDLAAHPRYAVNRPPRFQRGVLCQHHTLPRSSAGLSFWCDVLPNCNDAIRGCMQPGASQQRQRIVADVRWPRRGAVLAARFRARTGQPRQHRASVVRSDGYGWDAPVPNGARSRPNPLCPTREAGTILPKSNRPPLTESGRAVGCDRRGVGRLVGDP